MNKIVRKFSLIVLVITLSLVAGCVTKTDIETLQIERQQDLNRVKQLEAELEESKQLLKEDIERSQSPVRAQAADMWAEIQSLRADFAKLRGEIDTVTIRMDRQLGSPHSTTTMDTLGEQLDEIEFVLENQLQVDMPKVREERAAALAAAMVPTDANATAVETTGQPAPEAATPLEPKADTDPAKALYDKAYALYKEGKYEIGRAHV